MSVADKVRRQIATARAHEAQTGALAEALVRMVQNNPNLTSVQRREALSGLPSFTAALIDQIERIPDLFDALLSGSRDTGTHYAQIAEQLVVALGCYWAEPDDVLPDHLGMIGVLDDAYCSFASLDRLSKASAMNGQTLLPDLAPVAQTFRTLVGEPAASQLDALVENGMRKPEWTGFLQLISRMVSLMPAASMNSERHPIWGNMTTNQIVDHRVKSLGIF
jgi:uncharacterized membrane protein YkvA (DUF1232 family)